MYSEEVKDLRKQNLIYDLKMLKEFIIIYSKLIVLMPNEIEVRNNFIIIARKWFCYSKREKEILNYILKNYGQVEDNLGVDEVLEQLDEIFENMFDYYDEILDGYEDMLILKERYRARFNEPEFETLTEEKKMSLIKMLADS